MKRCTSCERQIPTVAMHCVYCGGGQAAAARAPSTPTAPPPVPEGATSPAGTAALKAALTQAETSPLETEAFETDDAPKLVAALLGESPADADPTELTDGVAPDDERGPAPPILDLQPIALAVEPGPRGGTMAAPVGTTAVAVYAPFTRPARIGMIVAGLALVLAYVLPTYLPAVGIQIVSELDVFLAPKLVAGLGALLLVFGLVPLEARVRGIVAVTVGLTSLSLLGTMPSDFLVSLWDLRNLPLVAVLCLLPAGLLVRAGLSASLGARLITTIGTAVALAPFALSEGSRLRAVELAYEVLGGSRQAILTRLLAGWTLALPVAATLSLVVWLPRRRHDPGTRVLAWLVLLWLPIRLALEVGAFGASRAELLLGTESIYQTASFLALQLLVVTGLCALVGRQATSWEQALTPTPVDVAALLAALGAPAWREYGRSVEDRPLWVRDFPGDGAPVLFFGLIHGDEPLGADCLVRLAALLETRPPGPRAVWLAPIVNPDGALRGAKNNARDVDLNRNWPATNWQRDHEPRYDPGSAPLSEPESRALEALIAASGARRLVALHSPFRTVNWDGAGRGLAERMAAHNGYGASGDIGYPTPGSFGSCYGVDRGYEVITLEIPPMSADQAWLENRAALLEALVD